MELKVTFGKGREVTYRRFEYPIFVNGVEIATITSSSYDKHSRRSTSKGYEAYFSYSGKSIRASGELLSDAKYMVSKLLHEAFQSA